MSLMGRGAACGIQIYKSGGISTDGKQIAESSGTVRCEILQLYVLIACQSQTCFSLQAERTESRPVSGPRRAAAPVQLLVSFCCCAGWGADCIFSGRSRLKITAVIFKGD